LHIFGGVVLTLKIEDVVCVIAKGTRIKCRNALHRAERFGKEASDLQCRFHLLACILRANASAVLPALDQWRIRVGAWPEQSQLTK
jgi:hypothetical protein